MNVIKVKEIKETISEVEYDISPLVNEGFDSIEEQAEMIVSDLSLKSGEIEFDGDEFYVEGTTKQGKHIIIIQNGEFDMYGGPYEPKMEEPTIEIDGEDIYKQVRKCFEDYGWFDSGVREFDVTRTDIWGHLVK
jgi:uncharacterized protein with PhoU and TrkA domain